MAKEIVYLEKICQLEDSELKEFLRDYPTELLACVRNCWWVFRSLQQQQQQEEVVGGGGIAEKVASLLQNFKYFGFDGLVQFWAPITDVGAGQRLLLTTAHQPFALSYIPWNPDNLMEYRKQCLRFNYVVVDVEQDEEELGEILARGIPGRAFRNKFPEFSHEIDFDTDTEFSLRDFAVQCNINQILAVPVFENSTRNCVGVLEILAKNCASAAIFNMAEDLREAANSESLYIQPLVTQFEYPSSVLAEIQEGLNKVCVTSECHVALTWSKSEMSVGVNGNHPDEELLFPLPCKYWSNNNSYLAFRHHSYFLPCRKGMGVVGKALELGAPCFCKDLTQFSISDYPLMHFALELQLTACFAVCLRYKEKENHDIVLELFLRKEEEYVGGFDNFLKSLLETIGKSFPSFEVVSEGKKLFVQIDNSTFTNHLSVMERSSRFRENWITDLEKDASPSVKNYPAKLSEKENFQHPCQLKQNEVVLDFPSSWNNNHIQPPCSLEALKKCVGMKLGDAAARFNISRSTLKRRCRAKGIDRWPFPKKTKVRNVKMNEILQVDEKNTQDISSSPPTTDQIPAASPHQIQNVASLEDKGTTIIKARCQGYVVKFTIPSSSRMEDLENEVIKRFPLDKETFCMEYNDEDGDDILIACDEDMQTCMNSFRSSKHINITISTKDNITRSTKRRSELKMDEEPKGKEENFSKDNVQLQEQVVKMPLHVLFCDNVQGKHALEKFISGKIEDPEQILVEIGGEFLYHEDLRDLLSPENWISSKVINTATALLTAEEQTRHPNNPHFWYLPTYIHEFLLNKSSDVRTIYDRFKRYMKDELCECEKIFIPVNEKNQHWHLCIIDLKNGVVDHLDSLPDIEVSRHNQITILMDQMAELLEYIGGMKYLNKVRSLPIQKPDWVPSQDNGWECGLYVIKFMLEDYGPNSYPAPGEKLDSMDERYKLAIKMLNHEANVRRDTMIEFVSPFCDV